MRYVYPAVATLVALTIFTPSAEFGQGTPPLLSVGNYQLVGQQRATLTQAFITYRADLANSGNGAPATSATVTSTVPAVQVVPGQDTLHFAPVPANGHLTSTDTFTILVDRTVPFSFSSLQWSFDAPKADAGANQTVAVGRTVSLNGSASSNPSGSGMLTYGWSFASRPAGSSAVLAKPGGVMPSFVPDVSGDYVLTLTVNNGSAADSANVTVSTINSAPQANAGPNQTVVAGSTVTLNGSASSDPDGNPLTFLWSLVSMPTGSNASLLTDYNAVSPTFKADLAGTYVVQLVVNDGHASSAPATVAITTGNTPAVANAGPNQHVGLGSAVQLDGSASTDVNGDALSYKWSLLEAPAGSTASLSDTAAVRPTLTADVAGVYIAQLIVNDGSIDSAPSTVVITTNTVLPPVANAGPAQLVASGATVSLKGTGSDPQSLPLTFTWALTVRPTGSTATLSSATGADSTFIADLPGAYVAQLTASNGTMVSAPSTVLISTSSIQPVANPGQIRNVAPGTAVTLDGSGSSDSNHNPLSYSWSLSSRPQGSSATLSAANTVSPTFVADLAGLYVVQLIVNDGNTSSVPKTVVVTAGSTKISLAPNPLNLLLGIPGTLTVTLNAPAARGGVLVNFTGFDPSVISLPSNVLIPANSTSASVSVTGLVTGSTGILASGGGNQPAMVAVNVSASGIALTLAAPGVGVSHTINGTVTLSAPAPAGGTVVMLAAGPAGSVTINPAAVTIAAGGKTGSFSVTGVTPGTTTITGTSAGYTNGTVSVLVTQLGTIGLAQNISVGPGQTSPLAVKLSTPAPTGGLTITLTSSDTSKATITSSVFVAQGAIAPATQPQVTGINFGTVTISASASGYSGDSQTVKVGAALSFSPQTVTFGAGGTQNITLNLSAPAPSDLAITIASSNTAAATVPPVVTIAAHATSVAVPVKTLAAGTTVISASSSAPNVTGAAANVTVTVFGGIILPANVPVGIGQSAPLVVTLSSPAPASGVTLTLSSSDPTKVTVSPATITIAGGHVQPAVQPQVSGVSLGSATISASAPGFVAASTSVQVTASLNLSPASLTLTGTETKSLTVTLSAAAPAGGLTVNLAANPGGIVSIPGSILIAANTSSASFSVTGVKGGSTSITASTAVPNIASGTASVVVQAGGTIGLPSNVTLSPGQSQPFAVTLPVAAGAGGVTVTLSSSDSSTVSISPLTVNIPAGATQPAAQPQVTGGKFGSATISASAAGYVTGSQVVTVGATLSFAPPTLTLTGPGAQNLTLKLSAPAPAGGVVVTLSATPAGIIAIPASVTLAAGATSATVPVTAVSAGAATITASTSIPTVPSAKATVTVQNAAAITVPVNVSLSLGQSAPFAVTLPSPAGAGGVIVTLSSSDSSTVSISPATVTIPAGATQPAIQPRVTAIKNGSATITASATLFTSGTGVVQVSTTPALISIAGGTLQSAHVNTAFANPLKVLVKDASNHPLSGIIVTFTVIPGTNGAGGTFAGGQNTATTDATGVATSATLTANSTIGTYSVKASVGTLSVLFSLTNTVGGPASITATSGTPQSAKIQTAFAAPLIATVKDAGGNPVNGVTVTFAAPASGASGTFAGGIHTATTNAQGVATSAVFTANGTMGSYSVSASVVGVTTPALFSLTNSSGNLASLTATSGSPQSAKVNTAFASPLVVTAKDTGGNPVSGVVVTFSAPGIGASGSFAGGVKTATTNAQGVATSATFTANGTIGSYTVLATAPGVATGAAFALTNLVGAPASITATSGTPQTTTIGTAFAAPLVVTVKDAGGNPVGGVLVTFAAPASGASGSFAGGVNTATTNAQGVATSGLFTANATAGNYNVVVSVGGLASTAAFNLTNKSGSAGSITATGGSPQTATVKTPFASPLIATVKDSGGNAVSGVSVAFAAPLSGPSGTFAGGSTTSFATTNAQGVATSALFTANSLAGSYAVTASVKVQNTSLSTSFSLTNKAGAAASIAVTNGSPQTTQVNSAFATPLQVVVKDASANPVAGVPVTFTAPATGASASFSGGVSTVTATTDASGLATAPVLTANGTTGNYSVTATAGALSTAFALTNKSGGAVSIAATGGTPQTATVKTAFALPLTATVKDAGGNPVSGVSVTFTAPASGASGTFVGGGAANTALTNAQGVATSTAFTANSVAGSYTVTAATGALSAAFALTNQSGPVGSITVVSGTPQSANINTTFANPLVVLVKDTNGNLVSGATVTFTAPATGASGAFAGGHNTAITNASGVATSSAFTANSKAGTYTVSANIGAITAAFSLTNKPGSAASISAAAGSGQSAVGGTAFAIPLKALITDAGSNPVSGVTVTFAAPGSGASGTFANGTATTTAVTDATGVATASIFTSNRTLGTYGVTATAGALSTSFSLTNTQGLPASVAVQSGNGQSAQVNTAFQNLLAAVVKDAGGQALSGVTVTFTTPATGASATFAGGHTTTAITNGSGVATSSALSANSSAGTYNATATVQSGGKQLTASFSLTNTPGLAASLSAAGGSGQSAQINTNFSSPLTAKVVDSFGNPVSSAIVTFTAPGSGQSGTFANGLATTTATSNASGLATSSTFTANGASGSYNVSATLPGITQAATFSLTNNGVVSGGSITVSNAIIGQNLQAPISITLNPPPPSNGVLVTITSSDPSLALVGNNKSAFSVTINPPGTVSVPVEALAASGATTVTVAAPGYTTATSTITFAPSGFVIGGPSGVGAAFTTFQGANTALTVTAGYLDSSGNFVSSEQVRNGFSVSVPVTSSDTTIGTVSPAASFTGGTDNVNVSFSASHTNTGTTTVSVGTPSGFSTPAANTSVAVTVQSTALQGFNTTVGQNLEQDETISLSGPAPTTVDVTLQSSNPSLLLFSKTATGAGLSSITVTIPINQSHTPVFYVQALGSSGTVGYTASTASFGTVNGTVTLAPAGLVIQTPSGFNAAFTEGTKDPAAALTIFPGYVSGGAVAQTQLVAGGKSISVSVTSGNTAVGTITASPLTIAGGSGSQSTSFQPQGITGSAVVTASAAGLMSAQATATVVTSNQALLFSGGNGNIGKNLESQFNVILPQNAGSGGVAVTILSNSALLAVAPNATAGGANQITVTVPANQSSTTFYVHGLSDAGSATFTASASGFTSVTGTVTLVPSGVFIFPPNASGKANTSLSGVSVNTAALDPSNGDSILSQESVAGGQSVSVALSSNKSSVAAVPASVTINGGSSTANVPVTLGAAGSATVSVTQPAGFTPPSLGTSTTITVNP